ncbi:hypothetical protein [Leptolyngbya subtilissima]
MNNKSHIRWNRITWLVAPIAALVGGFVLYAQLTTKGVASARCVIIHADQTIAKRAGSQCRDRLPGEQVLNVVKDSNEGQSAK